jgi:protein Tex
MDNPIPVDLGRIAQDLQIRRVQVESVVQLLDEGNTVPFITRYRKERTGNLNEVTIREIQLRVQRLRELAERKETILKAIEAQGKLDADLAAAIRAADNPKRLEDLYLPFKPKKRTKASDARERGLEPLALRIWTRDETLTDVTAAAQEFVNAEKGVDTVEKVLEGVGHILAEAISEMATVRDAVRKIVWRTGKIVTNKGEIPEGQGLEYRDYFDYTEPVSQIPPHRVLAINRGDKEGPLKVRLDVSRPEVEAALFGQLPLEHHPQHDLFRAAAIDSLDRLILPSMEREVRRDLTEAAEKHAVEVFARNLGSLLLQPPIPKQVVMAIDPGFKSGCKVAVLDSGGQLIDQAVIHPHPPMNRRSEAKLLLKDFVGKHKVGVVAIGNGTACRETEELIAEIIAEGTRFSQGEGTVVPPEGETVPGDAPPAILRAGGEESASVGPGDGAESAAGIDSTTPTPVAEASPEGPFAESGSPSASDTDQINPDPVPGSEAHVPGTSPDGEYSESVHTRGDAPHVRSESSATESAPVATAGDDSKPAAEAGVTLGNGSGLGAHAQDEPHTREPAEVLPPISGGAPDPEEAGETTPPGADTVARPTDVSTNTLDADSPTAHPGDASTPDASPAVSDPSALHAPVDAHHFPVPDDWEPGETAAAPQAELAAESEPVVASELDDATAQQSAESPLVHADATASPEPATETAIPAEPGAAVTSAEVAPTAAAPLSPPISGRPPRPGKSSGQGKSDSGRSRGSRGKPPASPPAPPSPPQPHPADTHLAQLAYVIVNEAGASVYSTSQVGREELPEHDATLRSTISIGRRLQDPLSELVKIEPQNIGVGLYQHDVNPKQLKETLESVIASCVNFVGVDLNTASVSLLRHVSGLNQLTARRIFDYRKEHGPFARREQLMDVEGVGPATYTQAAGFLKLIDGENPLDRTWVHPESYPAATQLLEKFGHAPDVVRDKVHLPELRAQLGQADTAALASELSVGELTLRDIVESLGRPERDPRDDLPKPIFKKGVLKLEDLTAGMELKGTVLNVVDFGAFVDIGLKDSGLVHISQLANRYVKSPHDVVSVGDVVTVWVMGVDQERKRVSLTMVKPGTERHRGSQGGGRRGGPGAEQHDGNKDRENRGPGQGRRGPGGGRGPRPPGSLLTSPPVGAPSVATLAEAPARRPERDRDHARDRGPGPGGPAGPRHPDGGAHARPAAGPGHGPGPGPRGPHSGPGGRPPYRPDRDRDRGPAPRPPARPSRPGPPPPPLSKDALAGNVPLRTFGQLKQLWEARAEGPGDAEATGSAQGPEAATETQAGSPHESTMQSGEVPSPTMAPTMPSEPEAPAQSE